MSLNNNVFSITATGRLT